VIASSPSPHPGRRAGRLRLRPPEILRRPVPVQLPHPRADLPIRHRHPAAVHQVRDLGFSTPWGESRRAAFSQAISILLLRTPFGSFLVELLDGLVDGFMSLFRGLPLSRPILATVAVISFVVSWNNFLLPLVVLNTADKYPWTLGLMDYQGEFIVAWQLILAFITLTILPTIIMFVFAQKYLVAGLTAGAVKG
jgi:raffinose/stachyose/melibiose transport system permease protein